MDIIAHQDLTSNNFEQTNSLPFFRVSTAVIKASQSDKKLTGSAKTIFSLIYQYYLSCKSHKVFIGQNRIAEETGYCVRTVRNATNLLVKHGYISAVKNSVTQTYNYALNLCLAIGEKISEIKGCSFKHPGKNCRQYRSYSSNLISTSNIDLKENLNNKKEIICQEVLQEKCEMTEEELDKLPSAIKKSMIRIKYAIESKRNSPDTPKTGIKQSLETVNRERQPNTHDKANNPAQAITEEIKDKRKYKFQPQELNLGFQQQWQIKSMAIRGIELNPCNEHPSAGSLDERTDELAYRIEIKAKEELKLGKARNLHESLRMSWSLIERNQLTRYHGVKDEGALHAEQQYIEHEKAKKEEISGFQSIMDKVGMGNFKISEEDNYDWIKDEKRA